LTVNLPEGVKPGTYAMADLREAEDHEAQARVTGSGYGWVFGSNVDGVVEIADLDDKLTAAWDLTAEDRGGREIQVNGSVKNLALSPQTE